MEETTEKNTEEERRYLMPQSASPNKKENETCEEITREVVTEENTELLKSINEKLDLLLVAQSINTEVQR